MQLKILFLKSNTIRVFRIYRAEKAETESAGALRTFPDIVVSQWKELRHKNQDLQEQRKSGRALERLGEDGILLVGLFKFGRPQSVRVILHGIDEV